MNKKKAYNPDIKERLAQKLQIFDKFFTENAPGHYFYDKEPSEFREIYSKTIEDYQLKGKKLLKVSSIFQQLCETYYKNLNILEAYKESAEYQIERLEYSLDKTEAMNKEKSKTIEDLNIYIEDVEKQLLEVSQQRDKARKELQTVKESVKSTETKLGLSLSEAKKKSVKRKEKYLKITEVFKGELLNKDKLLNELKDKLDRSERLCVKEKENNEKLRMNSEKLRNQIFELKNKLSEEKLKKSNYKDLYKDLIQIRANKYRNYSVQTMSELDFEIGSDDEEDKNDLIGLEEEQAKAHKLTCSIEIKEGCDGFSQSSENMIYFLHSKDLEKRRIERCEEVFIVRKEKNLEICRNEGFSIFNRKKMLSSMLYTVSEFQVKNKVNYGKLCIKTKGAKGGNEWIEIKRPNNVFSAPGSPTVQVVKVNSWDENEIKRRIETPVVEVSQIEQDECLIPEENIPKSEEKKGYIASFCQSFRSGCNYGGILKPKSLFSNLIKFKEPISSIPQTLHSYILKK